MRSIPIVIGNTVRHLRYTFSAIEDVNQLLPGGFLSVFEREMDIGITHLLLWAGLQNEVSYEDIGFYLISENAIRDDVVLASIWKKITYALINDAWISNPDEKEENKESDNHKTLPEIIQSVERIAASDFNLLPEELYSLTPREFSILQKDFGLRDNTRAGLICATMANIHAKRSGRPFEPKDFIRVSHAESEKPQTLEEQSAVLGEILRWMA